MEKKANLHILFSIMTQVETETGWKEDKCTGMGFSIKHEGENEIREGEKH